MAFRTLSFGNFRIYLGDGGSPENFGNITAWREKALKIKLDTGSTEVPNDTDPDAPMWQQLEGKTLSVSVTGSGIFAMSATSDSSTWRNWALSGLAKNIRVAFNDTGANDGGYLAGPALLTSYDPSGKKGSGTDFSANVEGSDMFTWVPYS